MLLLVVQPDLENAQHFRQLQVLRAREQSLDARVDMGAEGGNAFAVRPRDETAPRPRLPRSGRDIVGIEEIRELLVENSIAGKMRDQEEVFEEPGGMRATRKASRQNARGSLGAARGISAPSSRRRRRTADEVAGGMPIPGWRSD